MPLPWFRKQGEELPEALKGMEEKDLVDAIAKSKKVDDLEAKLTVAQEKANEVDTLREQLKTLDAKVNPPVPPTPHTGPTSFLDNEDAAFNERLAPFAVASLKNQAESAKFIARQSLKGTDAAIYDKYKSEIEDVMKTVDLNNAALPQTWVNALDIVAGRHRNDILKMATDKTDFFSEPVGRGGNGGPGSSGEGEVVLTEEQKSLAKRLGITEDDYKKNVKEMTIRA